MGCYMVRVWTLCTKLIIIYYPLLVIFIFIFKLSEKIKLLMKDTLTIEDDLKFNFIDCVSYLNL